MQKDFEEEQEKLRKKEEEVFLLTYFFRCLMVECYFCYETDHYDVMKYSMSRSITLEFCVFRRLRYAIISMHHQVVLG